MRCPVPLIFVLLLVQASVVGQAVRDGSSGPPLKVGTGVVRGRVVDAQSGTPIARAHVRLNWGDSGAIRPPTTTDESGVFAFSGLPSGNFTLSADKATYLPGRYPERGQTVRSGLRPLLFSDGQVFDHIVMLMYHGGVITGRVLDAHGDPVESAQIQAIALPRSGRGKPQPRAGGFSNDIGEYRIARLEPGQYLLLAMPQRREAFAAPSGSGVASIAEAQPVPTFYPGVATINQAQPLTVGRGSLTTGVDLELVDAIAAEVSGTVITASGQSVMRGGVSIRPIIKDLPQNGFGITGISIIDGTFHAQLQPGEYELEAHMAPMQLNSVPSADNEEFGSVRLNVTGDLSGVTIQLGSGATLTGRILFEGSSAPPPLPALPQGTAPPLFTSSEGSICRSGRVELAPDWTFTLNGVFGTCTARFIGGIAPWSLKSIMHEGKDLMDQPITFTAGQQLRDVQIVVTDKPTALTFEVIDEQGAPTRDYVGLLFSTNPARWTEDTGRYVRILVVPPILPSGPSATTMPGGTGANMTLAGGIVPGSVAPAMGVNSMRRELITGAPAGDYYAIAVDDLDAESVRDPDVLQQLARGATRITLVDGTPAHVALRRIKIAAAR